jgi:hypothetical protein
MSNVAEIPSTKSEVGLAELATRIKSLHADVMGAGRNIIQKAMDAGDALIRAKRMVKDGERVVKHGEWLPWLRDNCGVSERRAQDYMKLAANRHKIEAAMKSAAGADLSLKWALGLISDSGTSDEKGALGKYERAQETLIKKLSKLEPDDIESAAQRTIAELNAAVGAMKPAKAA